MIVWVARALWFLGALALLAIAVLADDLASVEDLQRLFMILVITALGNLQMDNWERSR